MSLEDSVNEVLRKIGRNIMLFQQLELLLKFLVANGKVSGYSSEIEDIKVKQSDAIHKNTMGQLIGQYIENLNLYSEENSNEPEDITEPYVSHSFHPNTDSNGKPNLIYNETKKEALNQLLSERNELVHHLLLKLDRSSVKGCKAMEKKLDNQSEKIRLEIKEMQSIVKMLNESRACVADLYRTEEFQKQINLLFFRALLAEIWTEIKRSDGWAFMDTAGQLVKQRAPKEFASLKEKNESLKSFILSTEMFYFNEEKTDKGGTRLLYRLKPDYEFGKPNKKIQRTV